MKRSTMTVVVLVTMLTASGCASIKQGSVPSGSTPVESVEVVRLSVGGQGYVAGGLEGNLARLYNSSGAILRWVGNKLLGAVGIGSTPPPPPTPSPAVTEAPGGGGK